MDDVERELRDMLNDRVAAMPTSLDASPALLTRARRRRASKLTALAVSVVIIAGGTAGAVAQVAGGDGPKRVITPSPTSTTAPRPEVQTVACPVVKEIGNGQPSVAIDTPNTAPRVASGSAEQLAALQSFAMIDDPRYVVLGPETWSCQARVTNGANSIVVYDPNATPGQVPGIDTASIAIVNYPLWGDPTGTEFACTLFHVEHGCLPVSKPHLTVTPFNNWVNTFVGINGDRGVGRMVRPSSISARDGSIVVLTCRPAGRITVDACDTIVADYATRLSVVFPEKEPDTTTTTSTTTTTQPVTLTTTACPISYAATEHTTEHPSTAPRVPSAGDPTVFSQLTSFAATDSPRFVALGPSGWSCQGQMAADGDNGMVIYQTAGPGGAAPDIFTAPIAIENDWMWHGLSTAGNACSVSTDPAVIAHAASVSWPCAVPAGRTLTQVDAHVSTFVDADGARGASWMLLPSSAQVDDGKLSILTCRPNADLTAADCDTVIADWVARNDTTG
jgi:hypothetical protein